jgi:hypothetical protein
MVPIEYFERTSELERYNYGVTENKCVAFCCNEQDCKTFEIGNFGQPFDLERTFNKIRLKEGYSTLLYYQPTLQFENVPSIGLSVGRYTSTDSDNEVATEPYTHLVVANSAIELDRYTPPDISCHPMQVAMTTNKWVNEHEVCLPTEMQGRDCGLAHYGYRQGNYMGIPTKCFDSVGSTLTDIGLKGKYDITFGAALKNPAKDLYEKKYTNYSYPLSVPIFHEYPRGWGLTKVTANLTRNTDPSVNECEDVYLCPMANEAELNGLLQTYATTQNLTYIDVDADCYKQISTCPRT